MQKIKQRSSMREHRHATRYKREAILGALTLYLDFVNLFLFFLRIFGRERRSRSWSNSLQAVRPTHTRAARASARRTPSSADEDAAELPGIGIIELREL